MVNPAARIEVIGYDRTPVEDPRWLIVNYDLLARQAGRQHAVAWTAVKLDEAHFIKNSSARTSRCLVYARV
jgi:hypothetical protein